MLNFANPKTFEVSVANVTLNNVVEAVLQYLQPTMLKNLLCIAKIVYRWIHVKEQDARLMQRRNLRRPTLRKFHRVPRRHLTTAELPLSKVKSCSVVAVGTLNWILCDSCHRRVKWHILRMSAHGFWHYLCPSCFNLFSAAIARLSFVRTNENLYAAICSLQYPSEALH